MPVCGASFHTQKSTYPCLVLDLPCFPVALSAVARRSDRPTGTETGTGGACLSAAHDDPDSMVDVGAPMSADEQQASVSEPVVVPKVRFERTTTQPTAQNRRKAPTNKMRARLQQARAAQARAQADQVAKWISEFDANGTGKLERHELASLLQHLHPEAGQPRTEALDLLITRATELKTYTMNIHGDPNGAVGSDMLHAVVSGYSMYLLAHTAFDKHESNGIVALRDLPGLMREANNGINCEASDVEFVMDCCSSSRGGGLDSASHVSRDELLPAVAAWRIAQISELEDANLEASVEADGCEEGVRQSSEAQQLQPRDEVELEAEQPGMRTSTRRSRLGSPAPSSSTCALL